MGKSGKASGRGRPGRDPAYGRGQEDHERLALSFRAMGGGLWDYDVNADVLFCNARWHEIVGLDPATANVRSIADLARHVHPADVHLAVAIDPVEIDRLIVSEEIYRIEFRIVRPDGQIRWLRSVACVVRDAGSRHARAVGCVTDITEFRASEPLPTEPVGAGTAANGAARDAGRGAHGLPAASGDGRGDAAADDRLSEKERECLLWVSAGKTAWETAVILGRSRRTVEFHLKNAVRKLNASNKIHAATIAIRKGLL